MTTPTTHGQVPEALRIADEFKLCSEFDSIPSIIDIEKAEAELRRQHARIAELEAEIAGGVQALSAAPAEADMFWDAEDGERFGHAIDDIISDFGPGDRVKIDCAKRMPSIEVLVIEDGDDFTYQVISPTPAAEQAAITPETGNSASAQGAAITSESGTPPAEHQAQTLRRVARTTFPSSPAHRALHAFVSAMHDNHIKGDDMRAAMLWFLGYEECDVTLQQAAPKAAPGERRNTKTHDLLSTVVGVLMGYREGAARQPYKPGSAIDNVVSEVIEHLKDWPYPEAAPQQEAQKPVAWYEYNADLDAWFLAYRRNPKAKTRPLVFGDTTPQQAPAPLSEIVNAYCEAWEASYLSANSGDEVVMRPDDLIHITAGIEAALAAQGGKA